MTTGERIREARKKAGLTQSELARKLEIPFQSISQWERDLRNPKQETLRRIANALNCDFYWLLSGKTLSIEERSALGVMTVFNTDDYHIRKAAQLSSFYTEREHLEKGYTFSEKEESLISFFSSLNDLGQQKAIEHMQELTEIPRYQRQKEQNE